MTGACRFCGQVVEIPDDSGLNSSEQRDEAASCICDCPAARAYVMRNEKVARAERGIEHVLDGESVPVHVRDTLHTCCADLIDYAAESVSINFPEFRLKMKRSMDGFVVLEKTVTNKQTYS